MSIPTIIVRREAIGTRVFRGIIPSAADSRAPFGRRLLQPPLIRLRFSSLFLAFLWAVVFLAVFPFSFSSYPSLVSSSTAVWSVAGMTSSGTRSGSFHSGNGPGLGIGNGSFLGFSANGKYRLFASSNEQPDLEEVDYVEKDPRGRYLRVIMCYSVLEVSFIFLYFRFCYARMNSLLKPKNSGIFKKPTTMGEIGLCYV